jgi:hypothetical protein
VSSGKRDRVPELVPEREDTGGAPDHPEADEGRRLEPRGERDRILLLPRSRLGIDPLSREQRPDDPAGFGERCVELLGLGRSAAPADQLARFGLDLGAATWATGLEALARRFAAVAPNRLPGPDETAMRQMPGG